MVGPPLLFGVLPTCGQHLCAKRDLYGRQWDSETDDDCCTAEPHTRYEYPTGHADAADNSNKVITPVRAAPSRADYRRMWESVL